MATAIPPALPPLTHLAQILMVVIVIASEVSLFYGCHPSPMGEGGSGEGVPLRL